MILEKLYGEDIHNDVIFHNISCVSYTYLVNALRTFVRTWASGGAFGVCVAESPYLHLERPEIGGKNYSSK